ncbi:MAG: threonine synthase, partial [Thaumarchaeota archaeon]
MQLQSYQKCIEPACGLEYPITDIRIECDRRHLLDIKYKTAPPTSLKEVFYKRRNPMNNIFNESGVWRFRELLNFCQIDTEDIDQCSKRLVSLDGAEGRLSKPYHMSKVSD